MIQLGNLIHVAYQIIQNDSSRTNNLVNWVNWVFSDFFIIKKKESIRNYKKELRKNPINQIDHLCSLLLSFRSTSALQINPIKSGYNDRIEMVCYSKLPIISR